MAHKLKPFTRATEPGLDSTPQIGSQLGEIIEFQNPAPTDTTESETSERPQNSMGLYLREIRSLGLLSRDEEVMLAKRMEGGREAIIASPSLPSMDAIVSARMVETTDYRGNPVLAATLPVTGTPWVLVAKLDTREALRDLNLLALVSGAGARVQR